MKILENSIHSKKEKWLPIVSFVALHFGLISKNVKDVILYIIAIAIARHKIGNITRSLVQVMLLGKQSKLHQWLHTLPKHQDL